MESVISNGTLFYDGVPKWTRRKEKKENIFFATNPQPPLFDFDSQLRLKNSQLLHSPTLNSPKLCAFVPHPC